jgi:hypothetical protein
MVGVILFCVLVFNQKHALAKEWAHISRKRKPNARYAA